MKTTLLGLGAMGSAIAPHVHSAGFLTAAWTRSADRREMLRSSGIRVVDNLCEAVTEAEVVITSLADDDAVAGVAEQILSTLQPGGIWVDLSTISAQLSIHLADIAAARALDFLDAPVSGGTAGATAGQLSAMIGGPVDALTRATPVLQTFAAVITHVGPPGAGQTVKAANQIVVAATLAGLADAVTLIQAAGIDTTTALTVLANGLAASRVLDLKSANFVARQYPPTFRLALHAKDLDLAARRGNQLHSWTPTTDHLLRLFSAAQRRGLGDLDHSAIAALIPAGPAPLDNDVTSPVAQAT